MGAAVVIERIVRRTRPRPIEALRHVAIALRGYDAWTKTHRLDASLRALAIRDTLLSLLACATEHEIAHVTFVLDPADAAHVAALADDAETLREGSVSFRAPGRSAALSSAVRGAFERLAAATEGGAGTTVRVCLNGSGRTELASALRALAHDVRDGMPADAVGDETIARYFREGDVPDPDLLIQTGGELRIGDAMLYQIAYAELWSTPVSWPEFAAGAFAAALGDYANRQRRFGT